MTAIVLLPGMDGTGSMFADFASVLQAHHHRPVVVSYPKDQPLGYRELGAFARDFLPKNEPFVLLGESFSGPVAISLAAIRPTGLVGLVLCCTFARNPVPLAKPFKRLIDYLPMPVRFAALLSPFLFGRFANSGLLQSLVQALEHVPAKTLRARLRAVMEVDASAQLKDVKVPILYLQALEDRIVSRAAARQVQSLALQTSVVSLSGPHLLLQAMPVEAGRIVGEFCTGAAAAFDPFSGPPPG